MEQRKENIEQGTYKYSIANREYNIERNIEIRAKSKANREYKAENITYRIENKDYTIENRDKRTENSECGIYIII